MKKTSFPQIIGYYEGFLEAIADQLKRQDTLDNLDLQKLRQKIESCLERGQEMWEEAVTEN